jgi:hypothetical protein
LQNIKKTAYGHGNADIWCSAHSWQSVSAYSCLHLNTAGAFKLEVVWPTSLQPWSCSKQLPSHYLLEGLDGIIVLQQ